MTQKIVIECENHDFTVNELSTIQKVAWRFAEQDLRVNGDPTNIKIYVGEHYKEEYRLWVKPNGDIPLVERDYQLLDEADWHPSTMHEVTIGLIVDQLQRDPS